ncbi:methyltransferase 22 [Brachionus plicatilis]|uniref:Methyltransferase 22 n=1 Tax=Brachionus plicatilis TaxID=10195 RepID=A0A3M7RKQ9_BRAPC|nr:methyltransferase 22 [Brachionus plicatilis]
MTENCGLSSKLLFTSDIHIEEEIERELVSQKDSKYTSRIEFRLPVSKYPSKVSFDQDGDLITERADKHYLLLIDHEIETQLEKVGLQLWRSAFFLSDYLLNNLDIIKDQIVVELGSGLGITSYIASFYAKMVFCTDLEFVVQEAEKNWLQNQENLKDIIDEKGSNILFKSLDWSQYENLFDKLTKTGTIYAFNEFDLDYLKKASVFLAADVIYYQDITLNFFNIVYKLITNGEKKEKICIIANEKRINFDAVSLSITDVAFDLFLKCMNDLNEYEDEEKGYIFKTFQIPTINLNNYLNYKKSKYLEIWVIKAIVKKNFFVNKNK